MGLGAALAGIFSTMINFTWWPSSGDAYLLPALAAVFVGGTPTWGGVGTVAGGAIGAVIVSFIQTGVVAGGLAGFYVQFFQRADHHPVAARPPLEPGPLPLEGRSTFARAAEAPPVRHAVRQPPRAMAGAATVRDRHRGSDASSTLPTCTPRL